ncbi:hypothetical protein HB779_16015 [Phyllobacterium sp. 628]|uniref:Ig-like domain-containing protein n=1 Tax=Phyllobacterium sp. 628 TaxID=2718938 RepID=UPI001662745B|nr:Ig-like domain-containing protein [Phyllobacterium sp. 628]QND53231.1 hypothetical protein HB779_16015 [Phyllobacterium sp. 628]
MEKVSVKAGTTKTLSGFYSVNDDCSTPTVPTMKVTSGPSHGTVSFSRGTGHSAFTEGERRRKCNSRTIAKIFVNYTPAPGFTGKDSVSVSSKTSGSDFFSYISFDINVTQ